MKKLLFISTLSLCALFSLPAQSNEAVKKELATKVDQVQDRQEATNDKLRALNERAAEQGGKTEQMQERAQHLRDAAGNMKKKHHDLAEKRKEAVNK